MSVVLVTGGSRGIGRAIVEEFADAGHQVAFTYAGSRDAAESLRDRALPVQADVRDFARAQEVVAEVETALGPLDVLINNAGIKRDGALYSMAEDAWRDVIETNLNGTFNYCRAVTRNLIRRKGAIINITSVSGITGMAGQTNYSASKAGIIGLTKALAREVARFGVRVNAIAPGFIDTDMTSAMDENVRKKLYAQIPMGEPGTARQIARAALYLASPDAAYITGHVLTLDGGLS
ncbi:MAG: 3-oxoacyl-ACP reductase FabG [Bryobacterales bacterium]|jgi:3-oxoacyl-[acyl-carrier protein] reductase|nr:3-oxoacyl-ACP reductase FabG [Bryobacterales bacterium]